MHWKLKATIQNAVSILPSSISYDMYYWIQRHFGSLRQLNPVSRLTAGVETWKWIIRLGYEPVDKVILEVGTGRAPITPLAYWLMGAKEIITIDLNPYVKADLIRESLQYISDNTDEIEYVFGLLLDSERLSDLLHFHRNIPFTVATFLDLCRIDYIAPSDATKTTLADQSVDFHTSFTVFEHIPPHILKQILKEGNRIIAENGLFIHKIDYSDHFSHSDNTISKINFLQYSDDVWDKYAGNKYMYMNRLRHDDYIAIYQAKGHRILATKLEIDRQSNELLRSGSMQLDGQFKSKSRETLSITGSWIVSQKSS